jgi:hypothetical protein
MQHCSVCIVKNLLILYCKAATGGESFFGFWVFFIKFVTGLTDADDL